MTKSLTILVTGGSSGIGYFVSEQLALAGHQVIIAARNPARAAKAIAAIERQAPGARPSFQQLDLASLDSVAQAAEKLSELPSLDVVVANAGVVQHPGSATTSDGFETFFGTNHLGHFALLARLFPQLKQTPGARIVHLGSLSHLWARPQLNPVGERNWFSNYQNSKLAVMQFGFELDRRLRREQLDVLSVVAHPGNSPEQYTPDRDGLAKIPRLPAAIRALGSWCCQGKDAGAWPIVHAATAGNVQGGSYWGPSRVFKMVGEPGLQTAGARAYDRSAAEKLWDLSEKMSGTNFDF